MPSQVVRGAAPSSTGSTITLISPGAELKWQAAQLVKSRAASPSFGGKMQVVGSAKMPFFCSPLTPTKVAAPPGVVTIAPGCAPTRKKE